jgi:hypothetical protein
MTNINSTQAAYDFLYPDNDFLIVPKPEKFNDNDKWEIDNYRLEEKITINEYLISFGFQFFLDEQKTNLIKEHNKKQQELIKKYERPNKGSFITSELWYYRQDTLLGQVRFYQLSPTHAIQEIQVSNGMWVKLEDWIEFYSIEARKIDIPEIYTN